MGKINRHNYEAYFLDFAEGNLNDAQIRELEAFLETNPELRSELESFDLISLTDPKTESKGWDDLKKPTLSELQNDSELRHTFFIQTIENLLNDFEKELLEKLLENDFFAAEFKTWKQTILGENPDEKIIPDSLFQFGLDRPVSDFNYEAWLTAKTEGLLDAEQIEALAAFAKTKESGERELKLADHLRLTPAEGIFYPDKSKLYQKENRKIIPLWFYRAAAVAAIFLFGIFVWNQLKTPTISDRPIAQKLKPVKSTKIDSVKTEILTLPDTLKEGKSEKEPQLDEWQLREPDPVEYAENNATEENPDKRDFKKLKSISEKEPIQISIDASEPEIAMTAPNTVKIPEESQNPETASTKNADYKTLPELAENALAKKLKVPEENQDEMANIVAQRITDKVSKMLDTEIKSETAQNDDNNTISYTLRIGSFEFSRTKNK